MSVPTAVLSAGNQQAIVALLVACIQMIDYGHPDPILISDLAQGIKCSAIDIEIKWGDDDVPMNLLGLAYAQLADQFQKRFAKGHFYATALYRAFYRTTDLDLERLEVFGASSRLIQQLQRD